MNFKIDTKEKFEEITLSDEHLAANMTGDFEELINKILDGPVKNVVLSLENVKQLDSDFAASLANTQQQFYDSSNSFVICCLQPTVERTLDADGLLEQMNVTPTVSEAMDIVQMEEIERELLDDL